MYKVYISASTYIKTTQSTKNSYTYIRFLYEYEMGGFIISAFVNKYINYKKNEKDIGNASAVKWQEFCKICSNAWNSGEIESTCYRQQDPSAAAPSNYFHIRRAY